MSEPVKDELLVAKENKEEGDKEEKKIGQLEYEGEYLYDKKWNGKGYDENGNIIYELINGTGKVKEYDENGNIIYELNKENDNVKGYNFLGELEFEGEYLNGKRCGKGKEYYDNGKLKFEGEYLNGNKIIN